MREKKQQGIALITALIITTIALAIATTVMYRQQIHIRFSSNIAHMEQAYVYANGMEDWAGTILKASYNKHPKYDSLKDDWAVLLPPIPIPGGVMNGQLLDLQARINLNSLAHKKPIRQQNQPATNPNANGQPPLHRTPQQQANQNRRRQPLPDIAAITRARLTKLISQTVDPDGDMGPAENFSDIVKDWIDRDQKNGNLTPTSAGSGLGAESPYYQSLEVPYFSADTLLSSPTEIRLLKDITKKVYTKLTGSQLISTLPIPIGSIKPPATSINVNTANKAVFKAIGFDDQTIENVFKTREKDPYKTIQDFLNDGDVKYAMSPSQSSGTISKHDLDVKSSYFLLQGMVRINHARLFVNSILLRKKGQVSVIMRDFSNPQKIKIAKNNNGN